MLKDEEKFSQQFVINFHSIFALITSYTLTVDVKNLQIYFSSSPSHFFIVLGIHGNAKYKELGRKRNQMIRQKKNSPSQRKRH